MITTIIIAIILAATFLFLRFGRLESLRASWPSRRKKGGVSSFPSAGGGSPAPAGATAPARSEKDWKGPAKVVVGILLAVWAVWTIGGAIRQLSSSISSTKRAVGDVKKMIVIAPVEKWSEEIRIKGRNTSLDGLGRKYTVLWNNKTEEDLPRAAGVAPKHPFVVNSFRLKSRESEEVPVTIVFN